MAMTVIGTLSHEFGHYLVAKSLGNESNINFRSATNKDTLFRSKMEMLYQNQSNYDSIAFREKLDIITKERLKRSFWIKMGGPFQTILFGNIGFVLLVFFRKKIISSHSISTLGWLFIFLSLFWLRQPANLLMYSVSKFFNPLVQSNMDEIKIARYLQVPNLMIISITGIIGLFILWYVIKIIPSKIRFTFILSGIVGGVFGFYLWFEHLGKIILP